MQVFGEYAVEIIMNKINTLDRTVHGDGSLGGDSKSS